MKTLDEVIVELENYPVVGGTTLTFDVIVVPERSLNDALHYLKEYRKLDSVDAVAFPEDDNPALSWDELRQMEGKPVWIEMGTYRLWIIARNFQRVQYGNIDTEWLRTDIREIYYDKADLGKSWQAYRKERDEDA